ncbi:MAG: AAA family ATPase [Tannerella sp.]|nr:AAA family ATPase [Tannerella sp.]
MKADRSFARDSNEQDEVRKIDEWFDYFEKALFVLFDKENTRLEFDRKNYNFNIIEPGKEPYNLNQLSDGYSAIFNIVAELIMRMEQSKSKSYDAQGIVLIDEIETHLHIELQKKILPFLTTFFPRIQFIVTTHSPFVISSIDNAVICDLEKRTVVSDDLSAYTSEVLVEDYFDSDQYSNLLKSELSEYAKLMSADTVDSAQTNRLAELEQRFDKVPSMSEELTGKIRQIKLARISKQR